MGDVSECVFVENDIISTMFVEDVVYTQSESPATITAEIERASAVVSQEVFVRPVEVETVIIVGAGDQGPRGRDGDDGNITQEAFYTQSFVEGEIVYLLNGSVYPVDRTMAESVFYLLGTILTAGSFGQTHAVLLEGDIESSNISLVAGIVYLDELGMPASADTGSGNYVPLGYTQGGDNYFFSPRERYFR